MKREPMIHLVGPDMDLIIPESLYKAISRKALKAMKLTVKETL